jgi:tetratricopeptide (TPR) repeat protein
MVGAFCAGFGPLAFAELLRSGNDYLGVRFASIVSAVSRIPELEQALANHPDDCDVMRRLLGAYVEGRQYPKTLALLERLAALESKPVGKARYYYTMAQIARDHLANYSLALQHCEAALQRDPSNQQYRQGAESLRVRAHRKGERQDSASSSTMSPGRARLLAVLCAVVTCLAVVWFLVRS